MSNKITEEFILKDMTTVFNGLDKLYKYNEKSVGKFSFTAAFVEDEAIKTVVAAFNKVTAGLPEHTKIALHERCFSDISEKSLVYVPQCEGKKTISFKSYTKVATFCNATKEADPIIKSGDIVNMKCSINLYPSFNNVIGFNVSAVNLVKSVSRQSVEIDPMDNAEWKKMNNITKGENNG